jgi:hypothetical protein
MQFNFALIRVIRVIRGESLGLAWEQARNQSTYSTTRRVGQVKNYLE